MYKVDYGTLMAMKKARANRKKKLEETTVKNDKQPRTKKSEPKLILNPLKDVKRFENTYYWDDETTVTHSDYLSENVIKGQKNQILMLPPGVGKTAIAVRTIGRLQQLRSKKIPFVVISSRAIIDGGGWHRTIATWNDDNPNNMIEPLFIDTFDRFASLLDFPKTLAQICRYLANDGVIILDEIQNYKNPTSKRSKKLQKLSMFPKIGLSATPLTNNVVMDGASYLIMNGDFDNKTQFMNMTGLATRIGMHGELLIYDNSNRVSEHLWPYYPTFLEKLSTVIYRPDVNLDHLDMPDVRTTMHSLPFSSALHADMVSLAKAYKKRMFDNATDYRMAMIERVCADEDRLNKLVEIIQMDDVKQPLIFYTHNVVKQSIMERLDKEHIAYQIVSGDHNLSDVDRRSKQPIIVQYQSGSEGIELKQSNTTIFYENQTSYSVLEQARGRNRRRGMEGVIAHHHLVSPVIYDMDLFSRVNQREEISNETLDMLAEKSLSILE